MLTVSADRAVPVVAAVAEALGLPGIGSATAHLMTHKVAMRRRLAEGGVPQPRFAAVRVRREAAPAADTVGFPAVLKPADSGGQRGLFQLRSFDDLDRHLHAALAESPSDEAIVEEYVDGLELNGLVDRRAGAMRTRCCCRTGCGRAARGSGSAGFTRTRRSCSATRSRRRSGSPCAPCVTLGLRDGIAFPQLIVSPRGGRWSSRSPRAIPGGQMADLAFHALGVDLIEIALKQALGEEVPDEIVHPRHSRPTAIRFLTARPGPLPLGKVRKVERPRPRARRPPGSSRPTSSSRRARRSAPCASTATAAAT